MNDYILKQLNEVVLLNKEKSRLINKIKNTKYKKYGRYDLLITKEEKLKQIEKIRMLYASKISAVYNSMNLKLKEEGLKELENPYKG